MAATRYSVVLLDATGKELNRWPVVGRLDAEDASADLARRYREGISEAEGMFEVFTDFDRQELAESIRLEVARAEQRRRA